MNDGIQRYVDLASGLTRTTVQTTERLLAQFVRQGEVAAEHAERLLDEVVARSVDGSGALAQLVQTEVERAVERAGSAQAEQIAALRSEVDALRAALAARDRAPDGAVAPDDDAAVAPDDDAAVASDDDGAPADDVTPAP